MAHAVTRFSGSRPAPPLVIAMTWSALLVMLQQADPQDQPARGL